MPTMTTTVTNNKKKSKGVTKAAARSTAINMAIFETLLGNELWKKSEKLDKTVKVSLQEGLQGKEFVALYFGAQWSRVSTQFTPKLVEFYNQLNSNAKTKNSLEIIYVSSDQTQEEFDEQFTSLMPWTTMPADREELVRKKTELTPLFKSFRIPAMIILDVKTGQFVSEHGVKHVNAMMAAIEASSSSISSPEDDTSSIQPPPPSVADTLEMWRKTPTKSIQDAHKLVDYGGGTMSLLVILYQNPYLVVALIAIALGTPILKAIYRQPMVLIGFMFLVKRYLTPKGEQNMPGQIVNINNDIKSKSSEESSNDKKKDEAKSS
jgi:hypothetical protein